MNDDARLQLFDNWAADYDTSIASDKHSFPFDGYERVLDEIVRQAGIEQGMSVLDLGTGTGRLAAHFAALGRRIWATDFSAAMLEQARARLPGATLVQADLLGAWPAGLERRFDRIVSAYVLHEFDLAAKVRLLRNLVEEHVAEAGRVVIGDVAFPTVSAREAAQRRWADCWDDDEHYWAGEEAIAVCRDAGLEATYTQVSSCGGVLVIGSRQHS